MASVRGRIVRYRGQAIGEENTKTALIDPILRALGRDLEDLDEVRHEYRRKARDNPVDCALFLLGMPRLFVEAKALGENLGTGASSWRTSSAPSFAPTSTRAAVIVRSSETTSACSVAR